MLTIIVFFIVLSVLVLVHEFGHFWTARKAGAKVTEFGLGFPPRLFSIKRGETVYSFNLIPFGGFVTILGENESEVKEEGGFGSLPIGKRAVVMAAGVFMNLVLAVVLMAVVSGIGRPTIIDDTNQHLAKEVGIQILQISPKSPADIAGIKAGDKVISASFAGEITNFSEVEELQEFINSHQGEAVGITVTRGSEEISFPLTPRLDVPEGEGAIGVLLAKIGFVSSPWWRAPWDGLVATVTLTGAIFVAIVKLLGGLITGQSLAANLAGPIGIANLTGEAARLGIVYLLQFTAILSVNLAILNILPFPALDGGRLVFLLFEKIKGRPIKKEIEHGVNFVGFALLILLMVWVTWQDILKFF